MKRLVIKLISISLYQESLKPIFYWKLVSRWLPNANEINTKNIKCTCPTPEFCVGTRCNLYSTGLRLGLASGKTQILGLASCVFAFSDTNMLVSPRRKCGVGGVSQRQDPTPMVLRPSGI